MAQLEADATSSVDADDAPTRRTGPRRVYGGALPDVSPRTGDPLARLLGRTLAGRYEIDAIIGPRPAGTAYRAVDLAWPAGPVTRRVTVTVLANGPADPETIARLRDTAGRVRTLAHPAFDPIEEVIEDAGVTLVVSEYRIGRSLASLLGREAGIGWPLRAVLPIGHRVADGLGYAHRAGQVHGGIGLDTIVLTAADEVFVRDFGLRSALLAAEPGPRDDVLALARAVFALLAGRVSDGAPPVRPAGLRDASWQALLQALTEDPSERPASAEAFMVSLEDPGWFRRLVGRRSR